MARDAEHSNNCPHATGIAIGKDDLLAGRIIHFCGGTIQPTFSSQGELQRLDCPDCGDFEEWDVFGNPSRRKGNVLSLLIHKGDA